MLRRGEEERRGGEERRRRGEEERRGEERRRRGEEKRRGLLTFHGHYESKGKSKGCNGMLIHKC